MYYFSNPLLESFHNEFIIEKEKYLYHILGQKIILEKIKEQDLELIAHVYSADVSRKIVYSLDFENDIFSKFRGT